MTDLSQLAELPLRMGLATAIGGAIGLNRDMHGKPAGLRMLGLVALGAALATISVSGFATVYRPTRSAASSKAFWQASAS